MTTDTKSPSGLPLPTGTITFLFTDIEGSTRLWERDPDLMHEALIRHDDIVTAGVEQHRGMLVRPRGEGDSFFAVFQEAGDAIAASISIQQSLNAEPWEAQFEIKVRIAVHTGVADVRMGDYYGSAVNRSARLRGIGHGGQVLVSSATAELVRDLTPAVALRDMGKRQLKDLAEPEHVYQLLIPGFPTDFPPLRSLEAATHNFPAQPTSFIGRAAEIDEICGLLAESRCVTLTGIGGAGKSRLALEVGSESLSVFSDGVWFIELSPITDDSLVLREVASVLGFEEHVLNESLRDKNMLLLLDNCEHLLDTCANAVSTWLARAPYVRVLATSREALGIPGEVIRGVSSLSVPDESNVSSETLLDFEATRLFAERASSVHAAFELTDENSASVARIARRLDGIPLAIELAAAMTRVLSPEQIAARLDDRFRLLTGGSRTAMPRQRTLQAAIDWSYHSLSEELARLFDRLSVFRGGFTLEAAEHVGAGDEDAPVYVMDSLFQIVDKSLVVVTHSGSGEGVRYGLLETLRQYAGERLVESGAADDARRRHADYYREMIHEVQPVLWGGDSRVAVDRLEADHDNLRAAVDWALDAGETETALRLVGDLGFLWMIHRYVNEGSDKAERALAATGDAPPDARAPALTAAGLVALQLADTERAAARFDESIELYRQVGDAAGVARATYGRAVVPWAAGDLDSAEELLEENQALEGLEADPWSYNWTHNLLGSVRASRGNHEGVQADLEHVYASFTSRNDAFNAAHAASAMGSLGQDRGDYATATSHFEKSLSLFKEAGDRSSVAAVLSGLATAAFSRFGMRTFGDASWRLVLYDAAWEMPDDAGAKCALAESLYSLGRLAGQRGDQARASAMLDDSLTLYSEIGFKRGIELAILETSNAARAKGDLPRAVRLLGAAENAARATAPALTDYERLEFERVLSDTEAGLDSETFARLRGEGQAMSADATVAYALDYLRDGAVSR